MADRDRIVLIDMDIDGTAAIVSVDMIADRIGQFASGTAPEMFRQAQVLFGLYGDADLDYLEERMRFESGGDYGVEVFSA